MAYSACLVPPGSENMANDHEGSPGTWETLPSTAMHTFNISLKYLWRNMLCCKNIVKFTSASDL